MLWQYLSQTIPKDADELKEVLLNNRNVTDSDEYFSPKSPLDLTVEEVGIDLEEMQRAVKRIKKAAASQEKVLIFGDYDADGICATAILWNTLKTIDIISVPFIPRRDTHGYGITKKAVDEIIEVAQPSLIITVDNGIVAHEPIAYAMQQGIDVILTDHHQPDRNETGEQLYPPAYARIHTTELCGSTVSWMLSRALDAATAEKQLDLAGLATIADQVPLQKANRCFVVHGLQALRKTRRVGLKALTELAGIDLSTLTSGTVGYSIAPRINAMGRLAHGLDALRLLCTGSWDSARKLARTLVDTNVDRQDLTQDQLQSAIQQVELHQEESIIFVASPEFHEGVIGLIAGRLVELYYKPALVLSINGEKAKGSARSVAGINIVEFLREVRDDLIDVGGHPMAAGFGISRQKLEIVKEKLFTLARTTIDQSLLVPQIAADCRLPFNMVTVETASMLQEFEPFGAGNPEPLFAFTNLKVLDKQTIGREKQHLKLLLCSMGNDELRCEAVFWNKGERAEKLKHGQSVNLLGRIEINEWKGKKKIQLVMKDLQISA